VGYAASDQIHRRNTAGTLTMNGTSANTTFGRHGVMAVTGSFAATVTLQYKTEGSDGVAGQWIDAGMVTGPGSYNFRHAKPVPWRFKVSDYVLGTVTVYVEMADDIQVVT